MSDYTPNVNEAAGGITVGYNGPCPFCLSINLPHADKRTFQRSATRKRTWFCNHCSNTISGVTDIQDPEDVAELEVEEAQKKPKLSFSRRDFNEIVEGKLERTPEAPTITSPLPEESRVDEAILVDGVARPNPSYSQGRRSKLLENLRKANEARRRLPSAPK